MYKVNRSWVARKLISTACVVSLFVAMVFVGFTQTEAAPNFQINYQGKLTNAGGVTVADGTYHMRFWLLASPTAATTTAVWTEDRSTAAGDRITVRNGLFSVMLGSSTALTSVDFNQTLYLGIEVGGSAGSPSWDGEMSPRKILGTVPAAFEADRLDGLTSSQFLRSDTSTSLASTSASTLLTITQSGTGDILNIFDGATEVFTVLDGGNVGVGTTTPITRLAVNGTTTATNFNASSGEILTYNQAAVFSIVENESMFAGLGAGLNKSTNGQNTGFGFNALRSDTTGAFNTAFGHNALYTYNSAGGSNSAFGEGTLYANQSGESNSAFGRAALDANVSGGFNNAFGNSSLGANDDGAENSAFGYSALGSNVTGDQNTAIGNSALSNSSGNTNTGVGYQAGNTFSSGSNNTFLGANASSIATSLNNATAIGANAAVEISNALVLGALGSNAVNVGIGTSTPQWTLQVASTTPYLAITDTNAGTNQKHWLFSNLSGIFSIGTSSDDLTTTSSLFSITNSSTTLARSFSVTGTGTSTAVNGINIASGCFAVNNVCVGAGSTIDGSGDTNRIAYWSDTDTLTSNAGFTFDGTVLGAPSLLAVGSSTIGGGTQQTGLTINGGATTTGNMYLGGKLTIGTTTTDVATSTKILVHAGTLVQTQGDPIPLGTYDTLGLARQVFVSGKYAYVADSASGLQIFDISNPDLPTLLGTYDTSGTSYGVYVAGKYAYVADDTAGLQIIDISNPFAPRLARLYNTPGLASGVYVSGQYAYVADGSAGLQILDISNPFIPRLAGTFNTSGIANGVVVNGKYAYVADGNAGLQTIDISNPSSPTLASTTNTSGSSLAVAQAGKYVYIADSGSGLQIIDVADPSQPAIVGNFDTAGTANGIYVTGKYAYIADSASGISVINVASATAPYQVGTYDTVGSALGTYVAGKFAYVADDSAGLRIFDIGGIDVPAANIGALAANQVNIAENLVVDNNAYINGGLNVGDGGLLVTGQGSFSKASSTSLANIYALNANITDSTFNGIADVMQISHSATGTAPAAGIGTGLLFSTQDAGLNATATARIAAVFTNTAIATPQSALTFSTKNSATVGLVEMARLTSLGNFGLGTTTPNWTLQVASSTPYLALSDIDASTDNKHWLLSNLGGTFSIGTSSDALTATTSLLSITNNGFVGFGTAAANTKMEVVGGAAGTETGLLSLRSNGASAGTASTLRFINSTTAAATQGRGEIAVIRSADTSADFVVRVANITPVVTEQFRINGQSGSIGFGTSSPSARFAIHTPASYGSTTLFALASSTATATTTLFSISNTGSTTARNGIDIATGCFAMNGTCLPATALTSLNGQTGATQIFATTSSDGGFGFSSGSNIHTLNIPQASSINALGLLTSSDFTIFGNKLGSTSIDTSAELLSILGDETGTGSLVFNTNPSFGGNVSFASTVTQNATTTYLVASSTIRIIGGTSFPTSPLEGTMYFRTDRGQMYTYASGTWQGDRSTATFIVAASDSNNKEKADYIADGVRDEVEINRAINAAYVAGNASSTHGGIVYLLEGNYYLGTSTRISTSESASIVLATGTTMIGAGNGTKLVVASSTLSDSVNNYAIYSVAPYVRVSNLSMDGNIHNHHVSQGWDGLYFNEGSASSTIENLYVQDFGGSNSAAVRVKANNVRIIDNQIIDSGDRSIYAGSANVGQYTYGLMVRGNTIRGSGVRGVDAAQLIGADVSHNNISGVAFDGIKIGEDSREVMVTDNILAYIAGSGIAVDYSFTPPRAITIRGNSISSTTGSAISAFGMSDSVIDGNVIYNAAGNSADSNIFLLGDQNIISNNQITDFEGTGYAIEISGFLAGSTDNTLSGNRYSGPGAERISDGGTNTRYLETNRITLDTPGEVGYSLLTMTGSTSVALANLTQLGTGDIFNLANVDGSLFTVTNTGRVGIGSTTPTAKLSINSDTPTYGSELITNGNFDTDASSWNLGACVAWSAGNIVSNVSGCTGSSASTTFAVVAGKTYQLTLNISSTTREQVTYFLSPSVNAYQNWGPFGAGTSTVTFDSGVTGTETITFTGNTVANTSAWALDSVSIKEISTTSRAFTINDISGIPILTLGGKQDGNIAIGSNALYTSTSSIQNVAIGDNALRNNTNGIENTAVGYNTLTFNTTGFYSVAVGTNALFSNTVGSNNTAVGTNALLNNTSGNYNTASGAFVLSSNTTGTYNTGNGYGALNSNTTGTFNTAVGWDALLRSTSGANSVAIGAAALYLNRSATATVAVGYGAGLGVSGVTASQNNVFIGTLAGSGNTTGNNNVLVGYGAGNNLTSGSNNIVLGYDIDAPNALATNTLNIGNILFGTNINGTQGTLSSGSLGIGTTTPNWTLQVASTSAYFALTDTDAGTDQKHWLLSNVGGVFSIGTSSDALTATSSRFTITQEGNVGLGMSNPTTRLQLPDDQYSSLGTSADAKFVWETADADANRLNLILPENDGTNVPVFVVGDASVDNVDLTVFNGASDPLVVVMNDGGTNYSSFDASGVFGLTNLSVTASDNLSLTSGTGASEAINFYTNAGSSLRMTVLNGGNVGIGTSSPNWTLNIASSTPYLALTDTDAGTNMKNWLISNLGGVFSIGTSTDSYSATSTKFSISMATTSINTGLDVYSGAITYDPVANNTYIERLNTGPIEFENDAGVLSWINLPISASSTSGAVQSFSAQIDSNQLFTIYGQSNGSGALQKARSVFGTSTNTVLDSTNVPYGSVLIADGALCVDNGAGNTCASSARTRGFVYAEGSSLAGLDLAEVYLSTDLTLQKGEVVMFDPDHARHVSRFDTAVASTTSTRFAGVVSSDPGLLLGGFTDDVTAEAKIPLALAGRVPVRVSNEGGVIAIGDPISVGGEPGYAARATSTGVIIGFALDAETFATTSTSTIDVFLNYTHRFADNDFYIDPVSGNIGIGTTSPQYALQVVGDVAAQSFVNVSTESAKKDITHISASTTDAIIADLKNIQVAQYRYNTEEESAPLRLGLIAEEAPSAVLSADGKGVDIYKLATFNIAATQALSLKVDSLETRVVSLETLLAGGGAAVGSSGVLGVLHDLGITIENGVAYFKGLFADTLTVGTSEKRTGITLYDEATGEPYCLSIENGETKTVAGECVVVRPVVEEIPNDPPIDPPPPAEDVPPEGGDPVIEPVPDPEPAPEQSPEPSPEPAPESGDGG